MIIKTLNPQELRDFAASQAHSQFLQSPDWQALSGGDFKAIGVLSEAGQIAAAGIFKEHRLLRYFSYLALARGPIFKDGLDFKEQEEALAVFLSALKAVAPKALFLRLEPVISVDSSNKLSSADKRWRKSLDLEPARTLALDLSVSEEELLASFHQKTRYNIRLAQKKGVTVSFDDKSYSQPFLDLMEETGDRDGFKIHSRRHYEQLISGKTRFMRLGAAAYQGRLLAAGLFAAFGDTFTYVHGASSNAERQLMAPYALQWEAIRLAKAEGYRYYDFFGIDEIKWPGVTRFKMGFGGEVLSYPGTYDYILNINAYAAYQALRAWRRRF